MPEEKLSKHAQRAAKVQKNGPRAMQRVLNTPDGELLLDYLEAFFKPELPAFIIKGDVALDPYKAAIRDGQRNVIAMLRVYKDYLHLEEEDGI
jgi:hypothetical protein